MPEERKILPAILIGAGLVAATVAGVGLYALARAAPPTPPPEGYPCPYCPATFSTQEELEEHIQFAHPQPVLGGKILDLKWRLEGEEIWHSWPMVAPANTVVEIKWTVRNDSNCNATFVAGTKINPPFPNIYTDTVTFIELGKQGDLIASRIPYNKPISGQVTFEIGALAGVITSTSVADWQYAQVVDRITVTFTLY